MNEENTSRNVSSYFEGCGRDGPIKCIFLAEFHPTAGPKITCQVCSSLSINEFYGWLCGFNF